MKIKTLEKLKVILHFIIFNIDEWFELFYFNCFYYSEVNIRIMRIKYFESIDELICRWWIHAVVSGVMLVDATAAVSMLLAPCHEFVGCITNVRGVTATFRARKLVDKVRTVGRFYTGAGRYCCRYLVGTEVGLYLHCGFCCRWFDIASYDVVKFFVIRFEGVDVVEFDKIY